MEKMITYGIKYKIVRLKSKNFYTRCEKVTLAVKVGASLRKQLAYVASYAKILFVSLLFRLFREVT